MNWGVMFDGVVFIDYFMNVVQVVLYYYVLLLIGFNFDEMSLFVLLIVLFFMVNVFINIYVFVFLQLIVYSFYLNGSNVLQVKVFMIGILIDKQFILIVCWVV